MDKYMVSQILSGALKYADLFKNEKWKTYQQSVNQMLTEAGKEEMIQEEVK